MQLLQGQADFIYHLTVHNPHKIFKKGEGNKREGENWLLFGCKSLHVVMEPSRDVTCHHAS